MSREEMVKFLLEKGWDSEVLAKRSLADLEELIEFENDPVDENEEFDEDDFEPWSGGTWGDEDEEF